ncbi:lipopolysaccharide kinase InaA family protein [Methylobacillus flagellatus]|uniref:Lipopolysaccharide kinase n=1 Tax=Methylobacillus flagellatus (strain ATCC 51484 / DSM 6875 / VKM B-1610 / KT) TaxID=265072 RepID=Q1H1K5_METFK|nr:lipopolysaccharide kinase InaA family protein [Methylobacillus flagellatus]ABE49632.1 lipopolysaccharide kinase [Methylobacillus flagellatus KT]
MPHRKPVTVPGMDFDTLWHHPGEWFEAPNVYRQGWSGVSRTPLGPADGNRPLYAFLKRQHNFMRRTWRHPWHGVSTFYCEYHHLLRLLKLGVPVPAPLFFSEKKEGRNVSAILVTAELVGFTPLDQLAADIFKADVSITRQRKLAASVADAVSKFHSTRLQHRALYPKHILVKETPSGNFDMALIDLEKARIRLFPLLRTLQDLATLNRELMHLSRTTRLYFLKRYYGVHKLDTALKWIARLIQDRTRRKAKT